MTYSGNKHKMPNLRPRDYSTLWTMGLVGGMTSHQVNILAFPKAYIKTKGNVLLAKPEPVIHANCAKRLHLYRAAGYTDKVEQYQLLREGKRPYLHILTQTGAEMLAHYYKCAVDDLPWRKRDPRLHSNYVNHLIAINDFRIPVMKAVSDAGDRVRLTQWQDELTLKSEHSKDKMKIKDALGSEKNAVLVPDGYFSLSVTLPEEERLRIAQERSKQLRDIPLSLEGSFFYEADLNTETGRSENEAWRTWERKIRLYLAYFKGGENSLYYRRYGTLGGRVLTITTSEKRLQHLKEITESVGGLQRFWFSTFDRLYPDGSLFPVNVLLEPIWDLANGADVGLQALLGGKRGA